MINFDISKKNKNTFPILQKLLNKWDDFFQKEDFFDIFTYLDEYKESPPIKKIETDSFTIEGDSFTNEQGLTFTFSCSTDVFDVDAEYYVSQISERLKNGLSIYSVDCNYKNPNIGLLSLGFSSLRRIDNIGNPKYLGAVNIKFTDNNGKGISFKGDHSYDFLSFLKKYGGESVASHFVLFIKREQNKVKELINGNTQQLLDELKQL